MFPIKVFIGVEPIRYLSIIIHLATGRFLSILCDVGKSKRIRLEPPVINKCKENLKW